MLLLQLHGLLMVVVLLLRQFNINNLRGRIEQGTRRPPHVSVFPLGHGGHYDSKRTISACRRH